MSEISSCVKLSPKETVIDNWEVVNDAGTPTVGEIVLSVIAGIILYYVTYYAFTLVYQFEPIRRAMYPSYSYDDFEYESSTYAKGSDLPPGGFTTDEEREAWQKEQSRLEEERRLTDQRRREQAQERAAQVPFIARFLRIVRGLTALGLPLWLFAWPLISRPKVQGFIYLTNWRMLYFAFGQNRFRSLFDLQTVNLADVLGVHTFYSEGTFGKKRLRILIHTRFHDGLTIATGTTGTVLSRLPVLGKLIDRVLIRDTLGKDAFTLLPVLYSRIRVNAAATATPGLTY